MAQRFFQSLKMFLPFIGLSLFIYLIYSLDLQEVIDGLLSIPPIIIVISALLTIPRIIIRNTAWMMVHRQQQIQIGYWRSCKIFLMGYFYGSFTPGYVGQLMRIPYLKEQTKEPYGKLFINSFIETTLHLLSMYALMFLGALFIIPQFPEAFYLISIWIIGVLIFLWIFMKKERGEATLRFFGRHLFFRILFFIPKAWKNNVHAFMKTFYHDFPKAYKLTPPLLVGSITWFIIFTQVYLIAWSLGVDVPYVYFLVLFPIANMIGILPISIAGLGTRELTSIILFTTLFGISETTVFVFSIVGFLITDALTGFVGFLLTLTEAKPSKAVFISEK